MEEYPRSVIENYGLSTVELIELDMSSKNLINLYIDGKKVLMPVLNLSDYDLNCHCYAFIERLKKYRITMIDLLYTYNEIPFDNKSFREDFLRQYTRTNINLFTMRSPGIIVSPDNNRDKNCLLNAIKLSIQNSIDSKIVLANTKLKSSFEVDEKPKRVKKNSLVLQVMKSLYQDLGGKLKSEELPKKKNIDVLIDKQAIFMKNGEIITNNVQTGKYLSRFITQSVSSENSICLENNILKDIMSIYITGVNDYSLLSDSSYREKFANIIFSSNILEAFYVVNPNGVPRFAYAGKIDMEKELLTVNLDIERYFNDMNDLLFKTEDRNLNR